jgi:lactoylglutathione lyase
MRAMKVNHLHLMVPDVPAACGFFEKYFDLRKAGGNAGLTVLLDVMNQRMRDDGLEVQPPRREHAYSFYASAPGGVMVEVGA